MIPHEGFVKTVLESVNGAGFCLEEELAIPENDTNLLFI